MDPEETTQFFYLNSFLHGFSYMCGLVYSVAFKESTRHLQVVESPFLWSHHRLCLFNPASDTHLTLGRFDRIINDVAITSCPGAPSVFDIQASELEAVHSDRPDLLGDRQIRCLLEKPVLVKHFDFSSLADLSQLDYSTVITSKFFPFLVGSDKRGWTDRQMNRRTDREWKCG